MDDSRPSDLDAGGRAGKDAGSPAETATDAAGTALPQRQPNSRRPRISSYWPGAAQLGRPDSLHLRPGAPETAGQDGPDRATGTPAYPQDPAPTRLISPPPPPRRPWLRVLVAALAAVVFLGASAVTLARMVGDGGGEPTLPAVPATQPGTQLPVQPVPSSTASAGLPFSSGTFQMSGAVTDLHLTVGNLGDQPVRVSTPRGSGLQPRTTIANGTVKLVAQSDGTDGSGELDVRLNEKVAWGLRIVSGIETASYALGGVSLHGIDLRGGAARIEMTLPKQDDTIPIRMSGGVRTWVIATAEEAPVTVRLPEGGGAVSLNGRRVEGIRRGTTLVDRVNDADSGGLDIDAVAGLGTLTVSARR